MKNNITTKDIKGNFHGYQEWYGFLHGKLQIRGFLKHNKVIRYYEDHLNEKTLYSIK